MRFKDGELIKIEGKKWKDIFNFNTYLSKLKGEKTSSFLPTAEDLKNRFVKDGELVISFKKEKEDIGVFFWCEGFSVGMTRTELLKLMKIIEDKDKLIQLIVEASI